MCEMSNDEGYLLCVFGDINYFKLADRMVANITKFDNFRKICILTNDVSYFNKNAENLIIKHFEYKTHLHQSIPDTNTWNKYGLIPKLYQYMYTPFAKTCFMDVDMLFLKDFRFLWNEFDNSKLPILMAGKSDTNNRSQSNWHWGYIDRVIDACGFNCPQIWSTIFIYDSSFKQIIQNDIQFILNNLHACNVKSLYCNGYPDEIVYSLLLGKNNIKPNFNIHEWILDANNCYPVDKSTDI